MEQKIIVIKSEKGVQIDAANLSLEDVIGLLHLAIVIEETRYRLLIIEHHKLAKQKPPKKNKKA